MDWGSRRIRGQVIYYLRMPDRAAAAVLAAGMEGTQQRAWRVPSSAQGEDGGGDGDGDRDGDGDGEQCGCWW